MRHSKTALKLHLLVLALLQLCPSPSQAFYGWLPPPDMCNSTHTPQPYQGPAPPIPSLPRQYSMKVEANILQKRWTTEVEEHYDSVNQRASIALTLNGSTTVSIFNFQAGERYDIYPNGSCQAVSDDINFFGFTKMGRQGQPIMATINEIFHFGTGFQQTYVGKETVRGITVDHWTSCQEWKQLGAKFQLDYYFADPDYTTAAGSEQIPVRAVLNGSAQNVGMMNQPRDGRHTFQHIYEFVSFREGPMFDEEVFQIPPGVVCKGMKDDKPLPQLPDQFEMSTEIIVPDIPIHPRQQYLRYDLTNQVMERAYILAMPQGASLDGRGLNVDTTKQVIKSVSTVDDFKNGIIYVLDKINMTCTAYMMTPDVKSTGMSHEKNLLLMTSGPNSQQFKYQGLKSVRGMLVDAWGMEEDGITQEIYFLSEGTRPQAWVNGGSSNQVSRPPPGFPFPQPTGTPPLKPPSTSAPGSQDTAQNKPQPTINPFGYATPVGMFLKNSTAVSGRSLAVILRDVLMSSGMAWPKAEQDWGDSSSRGSQVLGGPMSVGDQLAWGMKMERELDLRLDRKMVHVYNYNPMLTDSTNFQVSLCYDVTETCQIMLLINTSYISNVLPHLAAFTNAVRDALAKAVGVSVLQISTLVPVPTKLDSLKMDATTVTFTLLGAPPVKGTTQPGIKQLKAKMSDAIKNGIVFTVHYSNHSKSFMVNKNVYMLDYDKYKLSEMGTQHTPGDNPNGDVQTDRQKSESGSDATTYSAGTVAGIAFATLILGAVLCLGVTYFFYRRRHPEESIIPYKLST